MARLVAKSWPHHWRYPKPWLLPWDLSESDLEPAGGVWGRDDDLVRHVSVAGRAERHLGLKVSQLNAEGQPCGDLGILAIRCQGASAEHEDPMTCAIPDEAA